jgi:hypothetical protein
MYAFAGRVHARVEYNITDGCKVVQSRHMPQGCVVVSMGDPLHRPIRKRALCHIWWCSNPWLTARPGDGMHVHIGCVGVTAAHHWLPRDLHQSARFHAR